MTIDIHEPAEVTRCGWAEGSDEYRRYHDEEWGVALTTDQQFFEKMCLEGFQAGLSWSTILHKRPTFRASFANFDFAEVAKFDDARIAELMQEPGIVRNAAKIRSTINNARVALELCRAQPGALAELFWRYSPEHHQRPATLAAIPASTPESIALSKDLKKRGFSFVGPTTMYALMQSAGLVDDHVLTCFRAEPQE